ncbi:hypothetical protein UMZ34_11820 [Halopseudomonas pachastrellae]|nr:hypothetical protein UMZ34_11820 [Halopseudomonas pachastrellae]
MLTLRRACRRRHAVSAPRGRAGLGCALLPYYAVREELDSGKLQAVLPTYRARVDAWGDHLYLLTAPTSTPRWQPAR